MPDPTDKLWAVAQPDKVSPSDKLWKIANNSNLPSGTSSAVDASEYAGYMQKTGVHLGEDIDLERAQNQPWYSQLGKSVGNAVANSATGIVQSFGYFPEMFDDKQDYNNGFIDFFDQKGVHNPFGEIYKTHPDQTFDFKDSGWYFDWAQTLFEGAASLGTMTYGLGLGNLALASKLGEGLEAASTGAKLLRGGAQLLTATESAYVEGAMSGKQIFKDIYDKNYSANVAKGMDIKSAHEDASERAGRGASATVKLNTVVNTLFNLGETAALFHEPKGAVKEFFEGAGAKAEGETNKAWASRIKAMSLEDPAIAHIFNPRHGINSMLGEAAKEGLEEVNTQVAEHLGRQEGDKDSKHGSSFMDSLTNYLNNYAGEAWNQEGLMNFVSGAVMGPAQAFLIDHMPRTTTMDKDGQQHVDMSSGNVQYDSNGQPKMQVYRTTSKGYNERGTRNYFDNTKDAISNHIDEVDKMNVELAAAVAAKNTVRTSQIRNQLFLVNAINGIQLGTSDEWKKQYQEIAAMDNTKDLATVIQPQIDDLNAQKQELGDKGEDTSELDKKIDALTTQQKAVSGKTAAINAGYTADMKDNSYKKSALEAVANMDELEKMHANIQKKYVDDHPMAQRVADTIFVKQARLMLDQKTLDKENQRISELEAVDGFQNLASADAIQPEVDAWNQFAETDKVRRQAHTADSKQLAEAIGLLHPHHSLVFSDKGMVARQQKGNDLLDELVAKYNPEGVDKTKPQNTIDSLKKGLDAIRASIEQESKLKKEAFQNSVGFNKWEETNPNGRMQEYIDKVYESSDVKSQRANLAVFQDMHNVSLANHKAMVNDKGRHQLYKELTEEDERMKAEITADMKGKDMEQYVKERQKASVAAMEDTQRQSEIEHRSEQVAQKTEELRVATETQTKLQAELKGIGGYWKNKGKILSMHSEMVTAGKDVTRLKGEIALLRDDLGTLMDGFKPVRAPLQTAVLSSPVPTPAPTIPVVTPSIPANTITAGRAPARFGYTPVEQYFPATNDYEQEAGKLTILQQHVADKVEMQLTALPLDELKVTNIGLNEMTKAGLQKLFPILRDYVIEKNTPPVIPAVPDPAVLDTPEALDTLDEVIEGDQPEITNGMENTNEEDDTKQRVEGVVKGSKAQSFVKANLNNVLTIYPNVKGDKSTVKPVSQVKEITGIKGAKNLFVPEINPTTNTDTLTAGKMFVGDDVVFSIDEDFGTRPGDKENDYNSFVQDGTDEGRTMPVIQNRTIGHWKDANGIRVDMPGKMQGFAEVPIKIVHKATGKVIGYFPRYEYLNATTGDGTNLNNTLDDEQLKEANAINLAIRRNISGQYNNGVREIPSTIESISSGHLVYSGEVKTKKDGSTRIAYKALKMDKMMPAKNLQFGIAQGVDTGELVSFRVGKDITTNLPLVEMTDAQKTAMRGANVVFLPLANNKFQPVPLKTPQLSASQITAVVTAIEWNLQHQANKLDPKHQASIDRIVQEGSAIQGDGPDLRTWQGLKRFITQNFTHTTKFENTVLGKPLGKNETSKRMFSIDNNEIKVGITGQSNSLVTAALGSDGKLSPKFVNALTAVLQERFRATNYTKGKIQGFNSPGKFNAVSITRNGQVKIESHESYNEYVKTFLSTSVYGGIGVGSDGKVDYNSTNGKDHVYSVNSQYHFNNQSLLPSSIAAAEHVEAPAAHPDEVGTMVESAEGMDWLDDDSFSNDNVTDVKVTDNKLSPPGMELSRDNLVKMANLAASDGDRKWASEIDKQAEIDEVYNKLKDTVSTISKDFRPFHKC